METTKTSKQRAEDTNGVGNIEYGNRQHRRGVDIMDITRVSSQGEAGIGPTINGYHCINGDMCFNLKDLWTNYQFIEPIGIGAH